MLPASEWWSVLAEYSRSIFPMQIVLYVCCIVLVLLYFFKPLKQIDRTIKVFFTFAFTWIGLVFFLILGKALPAHAAQSGLFFGIGACFLVDLITDSTHFHLPRKGWKRTALIIGFVLVLAVYPLVGMASGRPLERWIVPGSFPCPTTALALLFFSTAMPRKNHWLYGILITMLFIWAIPFPITIQIPKYGVIEDGIMLVAGLYNLVLMILRLAKRFRKI